MQTVTLQTRLSSVIQDWVLSPTRLPYDLPVLVEKMKDTSSWAKRQLAASILFKDSCRKVLLTSMHENTEVISFQAGKSATLQIIEGKIEFSTSKETIILNQGQYLTFHDNINYSLTSLEDSSFLLTLVTCQ